MFGIDRQKKLSLFQGILPIKRSQLSSEIIAGITLASIAIPEVMGYTKISGTPVITGLYTILIPALLYVIFCSSRHLVVGADSATAAILASALATMSVSDPAHYVALSALLALMTAGLLILACFLKLGFLANFLSRSVLIGFLTGIGIQVAMSEWGSLFGVHPEGHHSAFDKLLYFFSHLDHIHFSSTMLTILVFGTIFGCLRFYPKLPGALIAVVLAIIASWTFNFEALGIKVLGELPSGLPEFSLPNITISKQLIIDLLPIAISMFVVILAQSAATSRAYANRYNETFNADVDLLGLAAANIGAGLTGTFVVNGSPTKTEILDSAGGQTQLAQIVAVLTVLLVLLFFTRPLSYLPSVVLSALVFLIGLKLIDVKGMKQIWLQARNEFWIAALTAMTVVFVNVKEGILLALVLSLLDHVRSSYKPQSYLIVKNEEKDFDFSPLDQIEEFSPGLILYHFTHSLYYANAQAFSDDISMLEDKVKLKCLCIESSAISDIDYSGAQTLRAVIERLQSKEIDLIFANVSFHVKQQLHDYGLVEQLGEQAFHKTSATLFKDSSGSA